MISQAQDDAETLAETYGYAVYMIKRYIEFLGLEETKKLLEWNEKALLPSLRTNTLKIEPNKLREILESKGFKLEPIRWCSYAFNALNAPYNLGSLHEFLQGYFYLQSAASMIPTIVLNPRPQDIVIDMCAAPGSKSTHLAQLMNNRGKLILLEKNQKRIASLEINLRRMGVVNSIIFNIDAVEIEKLNLKPTKVLLDAPCTGEGLIREDKSRKKSRNIEDIEKMAKIQKKLLIAGLKVLKKGGYLLYSTCSIGPEENEFVVDSVLKGTSEFEIIKLDYQYGTNGLTNVFHRELRKDLEYSQRIYPHIQDTIGFYFCLIYKR